MVVTQDKSKSKFNVGKKYRKVLELTSLKSIMWVGEHKSIEKFAKRVFKERSQLIFNNLRKNANHSEFVFYFCQNKLPQIQWLKFYKFIINIQFLRSYVSLGSYWFKIKMLARLYIFLETLGEYMLACLFQFLEAAFISWLKAPFLHLQRL